MNCYYVKFHRTVITYNRLYEIFSFFCDFHLQLSTYAIFVFFLYQLKYMCPNHILQSFSLVRNNACVLCSRYGTLERRQLFTCFVFIGYINVILCRILPAHRY